MRVSAPSVKAEAMRFRADIMWLRRSDVAFVVKLASGSARVRL